MRIRIIAALAALGLLAAACSSSGSPDTSSSASNTTSAGNAGTNSQPAGSSSGASGSVPSSSAGDAANGSELKQIVLQQSDLPGTWTSTPADKDPHEDSDDRALATCVGADDPTADRVEKLDSPDFSTDTAQISSSATRVTSDDVVARQAALFSSPKLPACFKTQFAMKAAEDPTGPALTVKTIQVVPGAGDGPSNVVARIDAALTATQGGKTVNAFVTEYAIKGPKLEADLTFTGLGAPVAAAIQKQVLSAMAPRVARG